MSSKTKPTQKQPKQRNPFPLSKGEIDILQREAGAFYLLVHAIMQNKRLVHEIVDCYLKDNDLIIKPKAEADAEFARMFPEYAARYKKIKADMAAQRAKIQQREEYLMGRAR